MGDSVESVKQLLRSVLLSSKSGVKASRLQGEFQELCGSYIPHTKFGYSSLHDFMLTLDDVVRIGRNSENELTYYAIADSSTKHMQALISKQRSKKVIKKKAPTSFSRHKIQAKAYAKPSYNKTTWNMYPPVSAKRFALKGKPFKKFDKAKTFNKGNMSPVDESNNVSRFNSNNGHDVNAGKNSWKSYQPKNSKSTEQSKMFNREDTNSLKNKHGNTKLQDKNYTKDDVGSYKTKGFKSGFNKPFPSAKKSYSYEGNHINFSKNIPPRFLKKSSRKVSSNSDVYDNPLQSSPEKSSKKSNRHHATTDENEQHFPKTQFGVCQPDKDIDDKNSNIISILENLKKLLSIYEGGLHLSGIFNLYKETFGDQLPIPVMNDVVSGQIQGCALVEKVNITGDNKFILFPYSEQVTTNEIPDNPVVKPHAILKLGQDYRVIVTYSPKCEKIYVQLSSEVNLFNEMAALMQNEFKALPFLSSIKTGCYVITNDGFRAKVLTNNKNRVEIFNIDFADSTASYWTTVDKLRFMSSNIAKYSEFCVLCNMSRPTGEVSSSWSPESVDEFTKVYADAPLILKTIATVTEEASSQQVEHSVIFYKVSDQYKFNINARLIEEENAILFEMENFVDPFLFQPWTYAALPNEEVCTLFVFNISCTTEVEVCIIGNGYSDKLADLEKAMLEFYSNPTREDANLPSPPPCNCIYAVLSEDNCTRGRLLSVTNDTEGIIYLVDNGETEIVLLKNLRALQKDFISLPMQSIKVSLAGLDHQSIATHCSILQKLNDAVVHRTCTARVLGAFKHLVTSVSVVELFLTDDKGTTNLNQLCYDLIVNENFMPVFPLPGCYSAVSVGYVDVENSLVYVRFAGEGILKLKSCLASLNKNISQLQKNVIVYPGKLCLVTLPAGLQRARVEKIDLEDSMKIAVFLIDVGICKDVSRDMLLILDDESTLSIPSQAVCCKLSGMVSSDVSYKLLKDVSNSLTSLPLLLKLEKFSNKTESNVISLWVNDESNTQIVSDEHIETRSTISEMSSSQSSKQHSRSNSEASKLDNYSRTFSESSDDLESLDFYSSKSQFSSSNSTDAPNTNLFPDFKSLANFMYVNTKLEQYKLVLDLEENPLLVKVVDVVSPDYLQVIKLEDLPARDVLTSNLTKRYKSMEKLKNPYKLVSNALYAFHSGAENHWYRAQLLSSIESNVSIFLIDYGGCRVCDRSQLYELDDLFKFLPHSVRTARLSGIRPLEGSEDTWSQQVSQRLYDLIKDNCYFAHILKITDYDSAFKRCVWDLCLCDTSTGNQWVNDMLVDEWNCANYIK